MLKAQGGASAADWVKRNRAVTAIRAAHAERAARAAPTEAPKHYSAKDLAGLAVQHDEGAFAEGQEVILTLKDTQILDDKGVCACARPLTRTHSQCDRVCAVRVCDCVCACVCVCDCVYKCKSTDVSA